MSSSLSRSSRMASTLSSSSSPSSPSCSRLGGWRHRRCGAEKGEEVDGDEQREWRGRFDRAATWVKAASSSSKQKAMVGLLDGCCCYRVGEDGSGDSSSTTVPHLPIVTRPSRSCMYVNKKSINQYKDIMALMSSPRRSRSTAAGLHYCRGCAEEFYLIDCYNDFLRISSVDDDVKAKPFSNLMGEESAEVVAGVQREEGGRRE